MTNLLPNYRDEKMKLNFLIVDSHPLFTHGLENLLLNHFSSSSVMIANNLRETHEALNKNSIDIIFVDIEQRNGCGLDFIKRLRQRESKERILVISSKSYDSYSTLTKTAGANGYITKTESKEVVIKAIENILDGYSVYKAHKTANLDTVTLSGREMSVLNYLKEGYSNKQISHLLTLSEKTISTYKTRIMKKYNASSFVHVLNATMS